MLALLHGGVHRTVRGALLAVARAFARMSEHGGCGAERAGRERGEYEFRSLLHLLPPVEVLIAEAPGVLESDRLDAGTAGGAGGVL
jgi:hypothetical protein